MLRRNRTVGRPPSGALTVSGRTQPSSSRPCQDREQPGLAPQQRAHATLAASPLNLAPSLASARAGTYPGLISSVIRVQRIETLTPSRSIVT